MFFLSFPHTPHGKDQCGEEANRLHAVSKRGLTAHVKYYEFVNSASISWSKSFLTFMHAIHTQWGNTSLITETPICSKNRAVEPLVKSSPICIFAFLGISLFIYEHYSSCIQAVIFCCCSQEFLTSILLKLPCRLPYGFTLLFEDLKRLGIED